MQWLHEEFPLSIRDSVLKDSLSFLIKIEDQITNWLWRPYKFTLALMIFHR